MKCVCVKLVILKEHGVDYDEEQLQYPSISVTPVSNSGVIDSCNARISTIVLPSDGVITAIALAERLREIAKEIEDI